MDSDGKKKVVGRYRKWVETLYVKQGNREEPEKKTTNYVDTWLEKWLFVTEHLTTLHISGRRRRNLLIPPKQLTGRRRRRRSLMDFPARVIAECTNSYGINESLFIYLFISFFILFSWRSRKTKFGGGAGRSWKCAGIFKNCRVDPKIRGVCFKHACGLREAETHLKAAKIESQIASPTCSTTLLNLLPKVGWGD